MTFLNEAGWDRAVRVIAGLLLLVAAWALSPNSWSLVLAAAGGIALGTGLLGWCPLYSVCRVSTAKTASHR